VTATFTEMTPLMAVDDSVTTDEDSQINIDVLANDIAVEGSLLSITNVSDPLHGTAELQLDDTINYLPDDDYNGPDSFNYTIGDGHGGTDTAKVYITVTPINDAPVLSDIGDKSVDELSTLAFTAQASDVDGDDLTFSLDPGAPAGAAIDPDSGFFAWTPSEAQGPGSYPVTVRVSDGLLSDFETLTIYVAEVNSAPVAVADHYETAMNTPLIISADLGLLANDSDADGDAFYADLAENPDKGALTLNADGSFTYTPEVDFVGTVEFSYCAYDGQLYSEEIVVEIEVSDSGLVEPKPIFLPLLMKAP